MKILAIIPARGGSKGVPRKNIKLLGDKPLLEYSFQSASQSSLLSKIILSSEDIEIIAVAKSIGMNVPFVRPENLASDTASSIEVVKHAIDFFEQKNEFFDAVCLLQATSPFREKGFIDKAILKFIESGADALVSVLKVPHEYNPHWTFKANDKGMLTITTGEKEILKRRQDLPDTYFRDGSIYITKIEVIKTGTFFGKNLTFVENNPYFYVNIDTVSDWKIAENKLPQILTLM
jgi:CMP-N,N'-diacetyllegionaminic acid synthase